MMTIAKELVNKFRLSINEIDYIKDEDGISLFDKTDDSRIHIFDYTYETREERDDVLNLIENTQVYAKPVFYKSYEEETGYEISVFDNVETVKIVKTNKNRIIEIRFKKNEIKLLMYVLSIYKDLSNTTMYDVESALVSAVIGLM